MSYVLISRDPRNGLEARISVPDPVQAKRIGRSELDAGRDLLAVHALAGEMPVTVEQIQISRAWSAHLRRIDFRGDFGPRPAIPSPAARRAGDRRATPQVPSSAPPL